MTIKECSVKIICEEGDKLTNKQIAKKVRKLMSSNTTDKSIAWYKNKINRGIIKVDQSKCKWIKKDNNSKVKQIEIVIDQEEQNYTNEAEHYVFEYEKKRTGQYPQRVPDKTGYDFLSEDRHIEVKASRKKGKTHLVLTPNETDTLISDPKYWLYLVEGDFEKEEIDIDLYTIPKNDLLAMAQLKIQARLTQISNQLKRKNEWKS